MHGQLSLADMPAPLLRVTPARLATWDDCPRRYRLTYLDRPAAPRGGPWAPATVGAVVHTALQALLGLPALRRSPGRAAALLDRQWSATVPEGAARSSGGFRDEIQAGEYRDRARGWVARYAETLDADAGSLGVERWVSAPIGGIVAEGRVDRIDGPGDEAVVVDYKTGRGVPDEAAAGSSPALALYALAVEHTLRRPCRRVELHHLPSGTVAAARHDDASLARHRAAAETSAAAYDEAGGRLAAGGDADSLFPPAPGPRCGRCEHRRACPEGRAAAPPLDPWELLPP